MVTLKTCRTLSHWAMNVKAIETPNKVKGVNEIAFGTYVITQRDNRLRDTYVQIDRTECHTHLIIKKKHQLMLAKNAIGFSYQIELSLM